jgi:hypothetical protein
MEILELAFQLRHVPNDQTRTFEFTAELLVLLRQLVDLVLLRGIGEANHRRPEEQVQNAGTEKARD